MRVSREKLDRAFNPRTVAVVGDRGKWDYTWLRNMSTFKGKVFSVQIDTKEIPGIERMGIPNFKSLMEIPEEVDYVVVSVPRKVSPAVIKDCIKKQVGGVSMFTSGFSESGSPEGRDLERLIAQMAREAGLVLFGPNCMGVYNPEIGLRFLPDQSAGEKGPVAFISQSGGHGGGFSFAAKAHGIGINKVISFGNGAVLESTDFLEYFSQDDEIKIIAMYIEDVKDGRRFFELLRETTPRKPVLIWKGGRTTEGKRAASSHTGAIAGSADTWDVLIRQCGAIGVTSLDQMIDVAKALVWLPKVTGNGVGIIGWSGGQSVSMTDAIVSAGFRVPLLEEESYNKFRKIFQSVGASFRNPVDLGPMNEKTVESSMEILARDSNIDILVLQLGGAYIFRGEDQRITNRLRIMLGAKDKVNKPFVALAISADPYADREALNTLNLELQKAGIPLYPSYDRAAYALRKVVDYSRFQQNVG